MLPVEPSPSSVAFTLNPRNDPPEGSALRLVPVINDDHSGESVFAPEIQVPGSKETYIKVLGPNLQAPLRSMPTPIDSIIPADDATLLQVVYSKSYRRFWANSVLFDSIVRSYGLEISHPALRQAVLGYITGAVFLHGQFRERFQLHIGAALRLLQVKLSHPDTLDVGDFCASYVLACVGPWSSEQMYSHFKGCLAIYNHLSLENSQNRHMLEHFGSIVLSQANESFQTEKVIRVATATETFGAVPNLSTFEQQLQVFEGKWESSDWSAVKLATANVLWRDFLWLEILQLYRAKSTRNGEDRQNFDHILCHIQTDVYAQQLREFVESVTHETVSGANPVGLGNGMAEILSGFYALELQIRLVEASDMIQAIRTPEVQWTALMAMKWLRAWNSVPVSLRTLRAAAIALPPESTHEGNSKDHILLF